MKKYLTKWQMVIKPDSPETTFTLVGLVRPNKSNGTVGYETMMVADEVWVRQNMGDLDLDGMELPEVFTAELKGREEL